MTLYTDKELAEFDLVEKWILSGSLMGITDLKMLWSTGNDTVEDVIEILEQLQNQKERIANKDLAMQVAMLADRMNVTYDMISRYDTYRDEIERIEEQRKHEEEVANCKFIKDLATVNNYKTINGPSPHQDYWSFTGDIGDGGVFDYKCRIVYVTWFRCRVWREWRDSNGKKQTQSQEFKRNELVYGQGWPTAWINSSPFGEDIPPLYTHTLLVNQAKLKAKAQNAKRTRKQSSTV